VLTAVTGYITVPQPVNQPHRGKAKTKPVSPGWCDAKTIIFYLELRFQTGLDTIDTWSGGVDRIITPKDIQVLMPGTCEYGSLHKRKLHL
jgi:hypothetical protein